MMFKRKKVEEEKKEENKFKLVFDFDKDYIRYKYTESGYGSSLYVNYLLRSYTFPVKQVTIDKDTYTTVTLNIRLPGGNDYTELSAGAYTFDQALNLMVTKIIALDFILNNKILTS